MPWRLSAAAWSLRLDTTGLLAFFATLPAPAIETLTAALKKIIAELGIELQESREGAAQSGEIPRLPAARRRTTRP